MFKCWPESLSLFMDVLPPQAQNRAPNLSLTSLFFLLQKPLHLPCQFALYNSSILDPKAASELKFSPHSLHNLPKIGYLFSPHSEINSLFPCYDQKGFCNNPLACQYCLEEGGDVALTGRMNYSSKKNNYHSTACHFRYDPLQSLSLFLCCEIPA